jgi:hypothetical protein
MLWKLHPAEDPTTTTSQTPNKSKQLPCHFSAKKSPVKHWSTKGAGTRW